MHIVRMVLLIYYGSFVTDLNYAFVYWIRETGTYRIILLVRYYVSNLCNSLNACVKKQLNYRKKTFLVNLNKNRVLFALTFYIIILIYPSNSLIWVFNKYLLS